MRRRPLRGPVVQRYLVRGRPGERAVHAAVGLRRPRHRGFVEAVQRSVRGPRRERLQGGAVLPGVVHRLGADADDRRRSAATALLRRTAPAATAPATPSRSRSIPCKALDAQTCSADSRCEHARLRQRLRLRRPTRRATARRRRRRRARLKQCFELTTADACNARPDCTTQPQAQPVSSGTAGSSGTGGGAPTPRPDSTPFEGCFPLGGCFGRRGELHASSTPAAPSTTPAASYLSCAPQDFSIHCAVDGRLQPPASAATRAASASSRAAPATTKPSATPTCTASRSTRSTARPTPTAAAAAAASAAPTPAARRPARAASQRGARAADHGCGCEPSFVSCQPVVGGLRRGEERAWCAIRPSSTIPSGRSPRVLGLVTGGDADGVADGLLRRSSAPPPPSAAQTATGRAGRGGVLRRRCRTSRRPPRRRRRSASCPRRCRTASISPTRTSCGEARITYALSASASTIGATA